MDSTTLYTLPNHLRKKLKKPIGILISGDKLKEICNQYPIIISVGDHVSISLIQQNIFPQIIIIDYKTKRNDLSSTYKSILDHLSDYSAFSIHNPAGVITKELNETIQDLCKKITPADRFMLKIQGEEDLAALPSILYAPSNATIIYGMPYKGVVIVPSTEEYKEKVRSFLSEM